MMMQPCIISIDRKEGTEVGKSGINIWIDIKWKGIGLVSMDNPQGTKRKGILEMRGVGVRTSSHGRFSARGGSVKVNVEKKPHTTSKKSR
jgi:hypothetical protein